MIRESRWQDWLINLGFIAVVVAVLWMPYMDLRFDKDRVGASAAVAAIIISIWFNRRQNQLVTQTLRESSLRVEPHLVASRIELRKDDWEELALDMNVYNVGLGHIFLVSAQFHWRTSLDLPENTELTAAVVARRSGLPKDSGEDQALPFVLEDGQHVLIGFQIRAPDLNVALQDQAPVDSTAGLARRSCTTPSEYLEGYVELHYRGIGDRGVRPPLRTDVSFADARILCNLA